MSSLEDDFAKIIRLLEEISQKLTPVNPVVGTGTIEIQACVVCGHSSIFGSMGYVCNRSDCPYVRAVS